MIVIQHVDAKKEHLQRVKKIAEPYYKVELVKSIDSIPDLEKTKILFTYGKEITTDILKQMTRLKWIQLSATGFDHLPVSYLRKKGIKVTTIKGAHVSPISEYAIYCMLYFSRKMEYFFRLQKEKVWERVNFPSELADKTLVIIGTGHLGKEIARKAKAFDMKTIGMNQRGLKTEYFDEIYPIDKLHQTLERADYLILVVPYTDATYHLIGESELSLLSMDSVVINLGRGELIDEQSAQKALKNGKIQGMALDVFHQEPLPESSPLWDTPRLIITPHMAARSDRFMDRCIDIFEENCKRYIAGDPLLNQAEYSRRY